MTKSRSDKQTGDGKSDCTRSVKSPPKPGSVKSSVVERVVRQVADRRDATEHSRTSGNYESKH